MSKHSVAETKNKLSELLTRVEKGEQVVITKHGHPVAQITRVQSAPAPMTAEEIDWLVANRVGRVSKEDAGTLLRRIRDDEDE